MHLDASRSNISCHIREFKVAVRETASLIDRLNELGRLEAQYRHP
ncbi:MAG: hypothetical protein ACLR6J_02530 [Parabacteroides merdae]